MGDLAEDTAVDALGGGRYRGRPRRDWEIWGPQGGYIASLALRAAGAESRFARPASLAVHYLGVADFDDVDLTVTTLRSGRTAESLRATMTQGSRAVLEATVWAVDEVEGLEHDVTEAPEVPGPDGLRDLDDLLAEVDGVGPTFPFWENFEARPLQFRSDWPPSEPQPPVWRQWERFVPTSTFSDDPWLDACRAAVLLDVVSWPSANLQHAWRFPDGPEWVAPSLDLYVAFHDPCPQDPWLLCDGHAPLARDGLFGWNGRLWSSDRRLVASGAGQALFRRVATAPG